jgi:hypothetical protein
MSRQKEGKKKSDKTAPAKTPKEKRADKVVKRNDKKNGERLI